MNQNNFELLLNESQKVFEFTWTGKLVSINKWHTIINLCGKKIIGTSNEYKRIPGT